MAKGSSGTLPAVTQPTPITPISPTARGSEEVSIAGREEKERIRKAFSHSKTVLSRGSEDVSKKTTLG